MSLYDQIVAIYPELTITQESDEFGPKGSIELCDDGDGVPYIAKWNYSKPIPKGMKLGK